MAGSNAQLRDRLMDSPVIPLAIPSTSADEALTTRPCLLCGWALFNGNAAAQTAQLFNGQGTTAGLAGGSVLAANGSATQFMGDEGALCEGGLFLHVTGGPITGCVYIRQ